jgi:hypothetical protein
VRIVQKPRDVGTGIKSRRVRGASELNSVGQEKRDEVNKEGDFSQQCELKDLRVAYAI